MEIVALAAKEGVQIPGNGFTKAERESGRTVEELLAEWDERDAKQKAFGQAGAEKLKALRRDVKAD